MVIEQQAFRFETSAQSKQVWRRVKFGDVVTCVNESCGDHATGGLNRVVGLEHLDPEDLRIKRWADIAEGTSFSRVFRSGQVLFGKRRAYQRKAALADFDGVCSGDILVFEAHPEELLPKLLPFIVQSDGFFEHALGTSAGSLSPRTRWSDLADYEFVLPQREEQARIADILWAAEETWVSFQQALSAAEAAYRLLLRSLLHPKSSWVVRPIREWGQVQLGRQRAPKYQSGRHSHPYLRVANVFDGFFDLTDVLEMDFDEADYKRYRLEDGDILLNEGQSRELVGRSAIWRGAVPNCCFQNTLVRFRSGPSIMPEFALASFRLMYYTGMFAAVAKQTTSIAHLGGERFATLAIAVPSLAEQREVVNKLTTFERANNHLAEHQCQVRVLKRSVAQVLTGG